MWPFASYSSESEQRNPLIAGPRKTYTKKYILVSGVLARGAIVGVTLATTPIAAAAAGNTGNGTMGAVTLGVGAKPGVYRLTIIEPGANAGAFVVEDPDGVEVGRGTVGVAFAGQVGFTLADGATDFAAGDAFTITVVEDEDGEVKLVTAAATDGTNRARGIASHAADATDGAAEVLVYIEGDFDKTQVSVGAGLTIAAVEPQLRAHNITLVDVTP